MTDAAAIRSRRSKLQGSLLVLALMVLTLLLAYQLWISYRDQVRTAEISTRNLAAIFETRLDATLRRTEADLNALANTIPPAAFRQEAVPKYAAEIDAGLDNHMFNREEMAGYRVHDANGDTLYSSDSAHTQRVNIADRAYFKLLRDDPSAGLIFSDVVIGRSTFWPMLVIVHGVRDGRGKFLGIVHGLLELEYYRKQFESIELGAQGMIALRRSDSHAQLIRTPDRPLDLNRPLASDHPIVGRMASGDKDVVLHYTAPPENIPMIVGISRMQRYPLYFAVGVGLDDILAGWRKQALVVGVSTLILFVLVGALLIRLGRMRVREAGILGNLAQSETQFRGLAQMVPVGICHFDSNGKYTYVNDRHMAMTGRTRDELLGSDCLSFVHPDDRAAIQHMWRHGGVAGQAFIGEYRFVRPDGALTHVLAEVQTEFAADGSPLGYIAALTDISQHKLAETELLAAKQQAERASVAKSRFLAAASHDLRQPIQAINLFRDALARTSLSEEQKTICRFLSKSVHSLGELLYSLLDISKLDAGLIRPQWKAVQVEDLFKALDSEFSTLARQKNLRFKLFYPFKDEVLVTDPDLMMSVLRNLIDNALKYTATGGALIGFRKRGTHGIIQVWDTGIGIEPEYGDRIFEECFQVGNPVRDRTKGLGLGLSIVRRTARLLGCEVVYRSRFGKGTVFEIELPQSEIGDTGATHVALEAPTVAGDAGCGTEDYARFRNWRVLVIEDDAAVATSIEVSLKTAGISARVFASAEAALASPDCAGADFYISDFSLPGMNGLQFLDTVQQRSAVPVNAVLVTGGTSPGRIALTTSSRWPVLFKPVLLSHLLNAMDKAVAVEGG